MWLTTVSHAVELGSFDERNSGRGNALIAVDQSKIRFRSEFHRVLLSVFLVRVYPRKSAANYNAASSELRFPVFSVPTIVGQLRRRKTHLKLVL
jgi:hypothetical protein